MPAIRDFAQGYHATITYKHVECPMPAYAEGDLLLAFVSIDDSAGLSAQDIIGGRRAKYVFMNAVNYTTQAADSGPADWYMSLLDPALNNCFYVGNDEIFNQINILNSTQGVATTVPVWTREYSKGSGVWGALTATDGIGPSFLFVTTVHAQATFTPPSDWAVDTVNGVSAYWVRWRCTTDGIYTTRPVSTQAWVFPVAKGNNAWRQLFKYYAGTTPAPLSAVWKTAKATEYDTTFFYVTAETANAEIISIRDVQVFADSGVAALTINCNVTNKTYIRTTGSWVTDGFAVGMQIMPTGNASAGNNRVRQIQSITTTTIANDTITVTDGTNMVTESGSGDERIITWPFNSNITGGGAGSGYDGYTNSNDATYRSNLPTLTTTKDDCLLIWAAAPDAVSVPSIIEGPCQLIAGKDGAAHADGYAWGYQKTAGVAPNNIYVTKMSALVTEMAVVAINPPHGGATVRPSYCISDDSIYQNPLSGPAFGSDSLTANTITTTFTGTINGRPLVVGTYVSLADVGINSYHAMQQCTGVVTAGSWAGLRTVIAERTNWANKNILFHTQPYLPVDIQTADSVSLIGAIGVAIGLATSAGNFKVWHVNGAGVYGDTQRHQPVVINTGATDGMIQNTGTFNPASITVIGFMVSGKVVAANWLLGSAWLLDTFKIVGGITAEPMLLSDIVKCYATGHERRSAIQQGSKQALFLGPVQIGDGTNFTYLNLDATAIEFPQQYNKAAKQLYYNSIDNVCGLKYCAKAGDTIIHKNSVISSGSRYFWGVDSAFSTSVTPDFSGLSVIGAGTVSLKSGVTFNGITFNSCDEILAVGATIINCVFKNTTGTGALNVATPAEMAAITNCTLSGNAYGIRLTKATADTYNFVGIKFSGNTKDIYVTAATGTVTINVSGGGDTPSYTSAGATVVIVNARTVRVTAKDAATGSTIQDARVALWATTGTSVTITREAEYFGQQAGDSNIDDITGFLIGSKYQNTVGNGTITKIEMLFDDETPTDNCRLGVYSDNAGVPGALLGGGVIECPIINGWVVHTGLSIPVTLNTYYWIAYSMASDNRIRIEIAGGSGNYFREFAYANFPNPFGSAYYGGSATLVMRAQVVTGSTAYVAHTGHGYSTNQKVCIFGANEGEYNGIKTITVTGINEYTYTVSGTPATPATGTILSHRIILDGDTNSSGIVEDTTFPYVSDLNVTGRVRKGTATPFYKTAPVSGTITSAAGFDTTAFMVGDD